MAQPPQPRVNVLKLTFPLTNDTSAKKSMVFIPC
jgi:hypothetical protein